MAKQVSEWVKKLREQVLHCSTVDQQLEALDAAKVTAVTEVAGKYYVFTANRTYVLRKPRWYQRLWRRVLDKLGRC